MDLIVSLLQLTDLSDYQQAGVTSIVVAERQYALASPVYYSLAEIKAVTLAATKLGIKTYVLVNRMFFDEDLAGLKDYLKYLKELKVAGIYFADLAVLTLAQELDLVDVLIYAPRAPLTNTLDAKLYLDLGLKAVELADEITLAERLVMAQALPNQLTMVIHGHLLMSFSRRPLLSNYLAEINKTHPVIDRYTLILEESTRPQKMPVYENEHGTLVYQAEILQSFAEIATLAQHQLTSWRIDGMFLSREHVLKAIKLYGALIKPEITYQPELLTEFKEPLGSGYYYLETNLVK